MPELCLSAQLEVRRRGRQATFRCSAGHGYHRTVWNPRPSISLDLATICAGGRKRHAESGLILEPARISLNLQREQLKTSRINQMWTGTLHRSTPCVKAERRRGGIPFLDAVSS
jgi:hypothetical protein